jgi:MFS family permease
MTDSRRWLILFVAWLGWVFDIMDTALFNFAKVPMLTDMLGEAGYTARGPAVEGLIQTIFIVGWALGGLIFGVLADRWGRSRTMVLTILLYCAFTGLTSLCQTWEQVAVVRFLTALGIGGEWAAGAALVAESFPDTRRPLAAAFLQTAAAVGPILAATANLALAHESWRWLFVVGLVPAVVTVFIRKAVGESEPTKEVRSKASNPIRELFTNPKWRRNAIIAMVIGTVGIAGAGNAAYWMPNLVKEASAGMATEVVQARTSYITYAMHAGTLAGVFLFPWLAKVWGRKKALLLGFIAALSITYFALQGSPSYESLFFIAPAITLFAIGLSAIFGLYFPELFPASIRATGSGFAYNVARIAQAPLPMITGVLIGAQTLALTMTAPRNVAHGVAMSALVYIIGLLALPFAPETKDKPLPE